METASGGFSYRFSNTILSANFLVETGLRETVLTLPDGTVESNGGHVPSMASLIGAEP